MMAMVRCIVVRQGGGDATCWVVSGWQGGEWWGCCRLLLAGWWLLGVDWWADWRVQLMAERTWGYDQPRRTFSQFSPAMRNARRPALDDLRRYNDNV